MNRKYPEHIGNYGQKVESTIKSVSKGSKAPLTIYNFKGRKKVAVRETIKFWLNAGWIDFPELLTMLIVEVGISQRYKKFKDVKISTTDKEIIFNAPEVIMKFIPKQGRNQHAAL